MIQGDYLKSVNESVDKQVNTPSVGHLNQYMAPFYYTQRIQDKWLLQRASQQLAILLLHAKVDESHNMGHAEQVLKNIQNAIEYQQINNELCRQIPSYRILAMQLAALLHDSDDHKYFSESQNALQILQHTLNGSKDQYPQYISEYLQQLDKELVINETIQMINLVSAAKNGNSMPIYIQQYPELLWPRFADRVEAIGKIGIVRCYQYNVNKTNRPLFVESTPRPKNEDQVWQFATKERFQSYQQIGESQSMIDHYFDKLLHICNFDNSYVQNEYLTQLSQQRVNDMVQFCIEFGLSGQIPYDTIRQCLLETATYGQLQLDIV